MYKKVYVEITNNCNLKCSFCIHNKRNNKFMSEEEFDLILKKLKGITNYLYFHVLGEPLIHPKINEFINKATENNYKVNITTNGYLIKRICKNKNIRQLNISLHSYDSSMKLSLDEYLQNIFETADKLKNSTYINYRLWVGENKEIIKALEEKYKVSINGSTKLEKNVFVDIEKPFIWPDLSNDLNNKTGKCYGLITHFGILVDGTIIPCCLDSEGTINLGNIYEDNIIDILNSNIVKTMVEGFKNSKRCELLCQHCGFRE